jgi:uncharacterized protein YbaP (TraB family)
MKKLLSIVLALLPFIALADSQPAMYTVHGKHNVVHLVGTVHLLQQNEPVPANISQAYADASQLLMEIDTSKADPMAIQELVIESGMLMPPMTLEQRIGAASYARVKSAAESAGLDVALFDQMRPWLVALELEQTMYTKLGFDPNTGIEAQLTKRAAQDQKAIAGLETLREQIGFFANLDDKTELDYLNSTLDELGDLRKELNEMVSAWRRGDEAQLQLLMQKEIKGHESFFNALIFDRNRRWITQLTALLETSDDNCLVAVGALHLVGDNGVVALLRKQGYKVTRD